MPALPDATAAQPWRHVLVWVVLALGLATTAWWFWHEDLRYSLPTPRRPDLQQPAFGSKIALPAAVAAHVAGGRPALLHFYNTECPCSRFNLDHLHALVRDYRKAVSFVAVVQGADAKRAIAAFPRGELAPPAVADPDGAIATRFGVYSTPQAVVLAGDGTLFFRGNYNLSRFCVDARTAFAQQALDAMLAGQPLPALPPAATTAYGCELPAEPPEGSR